jgi:hypothetical protein
MKVFGSTPHPRALMWGFSDEQVRTIGPVFATAKVITSLAEVEQTEWDVLVTRSGCFGSSPHLYVLAVEGDPEGAPKTFDYIEGEPVQAFVQYGGVSRASEFRVPAGLSREIENIVTTTLVPRARTAGIHLVLTLGGSALSSGSKVRPFLVTMDDRFIAGAFTRRGGNAECWCLPSYAVDDTHLWCAAAVVAWRGQNLALFPEPSADWPHEPIWRTREEEVIAAEIDRIANERNQLIAELEDDLQAHQEQLSAAVGEADRGRRILLTGQGDALCEQVALTLEDLGFEVERMDPKWPEGDKREDLRVHETSRPGWVAIVEVRGYRRGAQLTDLIRLHSRFRSRYQVDEGTLPNATWLITNHFIEDDPESREAVLRSNQAEIDAFGADGALVIDSVDLFRLWTAVIANRISKVDARNALVAASGRFSPPA